MIKFFNRLIYNFSVIGPAIGFGIAILVIVMIGLFRY